MKTKGISTLLSLLIVASLLLAACGGSAPAAPAEEAAPASAEATAPAAEEAAAPAAEGDLLASPPADAGEREVQQITYNSPADYEAATGNPLGEYQEAPMLAEQVAAGELPPVAERLPVNPIVEQPEEGIGVYGGAMRMNITGQNTVRSSEAGYFNYESLTVHNPQGEIVPSVAESWEWNDDYTTLILHLREGIKWSDGAPFTGDDILFWWDDIILNDELTPSKPSLLSRGGELAEFTKVDDYTIQFAFAEPYALFTTYLGSWGFPRIDLVSRPKHYLSQFHPTYGDMATIEAGMEAEGFDTWVDYFTQMADFNNPDKPSISPWIPDVWPPEQVQSYHRNPYYWKVDTAGNQLPYIDRIEWEFLGDPNVLLLRTLSGEVEFLNYYQNILQNKAVFADNMEEGDYHFFDQIRDQANRVLIKLNMNSKNEVLAEAFQNKDVRIALSHAINRQEIIDTVWVSQGEPWQGAPKPQSEFYNETLAKQYTEYDVDMANEILDGIYPEKNGDGIRLLPNGEPFSFELLIDGTRFTDWVDAAELVEIYWAEVGVDLNIASITGELLTERREANDFDATADFSDGGLATILNVGPFLMPAGIGSFFAPAWGAWYDLGAATIEPQEPPDDVKRQQELYDMVKATADPDLQREYMNEIIDIAIDRFYTIGIGIETPAYGVVSNKMHNVPDAMPESWNYPDPFPTNPSTYWLEQ
ncbi:MAG: ABC transporter substrate-binding protein [Caldilineaceae bacterium]|nr:ABC transporter substrate-binding protein [Caldilineaceae bacterium]